MTLEEVLAVLESVRQVGPGRWTARCPAHDDAHASLSVARGAKVGILLKCWAACQFPAVMEEVQRRVTYGGRR